MASTLDISPAMRVLSNSGGFFLVLSIAFEHFMQIYVMDAMRGSAKVVRMNYYERTMHRKHRGDTLPVSSRNASMESFSRRPAASLQASRYEPPSHLGPFCFLPAPRSQAAKAITFASSMYMYVQELAHQQNLYWRTTLEMLRRTLALQYLV